MVEMIMFINANNLWEVNNELDKGWTVKHIAPVRTYSTGSDIFGAYVVLQKEEKKADL